MKKMISYITFAPLSKKTLIISLVTVFIMAISVLCGFVLIVNSSNHLFYEQSSELLLHTSKDISNNLSAINTMANFIVESDDIQQNLSAIKDNEDEHSPTNAYTSIQTSMENYYLKYKNNSIDYMELLNDKFTNSVYSLDSKNLPDDLKKEIQQKAIEAGGETLWITDYADTYGVFMVRSIRRISHLKLDDLGTLIVNINIKKMIDEIPENAYNSAPTSFLIKDSKRTIAVSDRLKAENTNDISMKNNSYDVLMIANKKYFVTSTTFAYVDWRCYSFLPYEDIYNNILFYQKVFVILLILSVIICLLLTHLLMKPTIRDFVSLKSKLKSYGSEDEITPPATPFEFANRNDEIGVLHKQFDKMTLRIYSLIQKNYESELLAKEFQLQALQMQINPHFLYNTLNTINWRAKLLGDEKISQMTEALGKLLHITLSSDDTNSSLKQELELVKNYMAIQQIRFEDSLTYSYFADEDILDAYVPKFTFQPIIENAIKYTLEQDSDNCDIRIICEKYDENYIKIEIKNSDSIFDDDLLERLMNNELKPKGFGIGLANVDKRLALNFPKQYTFKLLNEAGFAIVRIVIPYRKTNFALNIVSNISN